MIQQKKKPDSELAARIRMRSFWHDHPIATGIPVIDLHHIYLMYIATELHQSVERQKGVLPDLYRHFSAFMDFLSEHFFMESQLLRRLGYPDAVSHVMKHNQFIEQFMEKAGNKNLEKKESLSRIVNEIIQWLYRHTLKDDMKYAPYLTEREERVNAIVQELSDAGEIYISPFQAQLYKFITGREIHIKTHEEDIIKSIGQMWKTYDLSVRIPLIDMQHLWFIYIMLKLEREARSYSERDERIKAFKRNLTQIQEYAEIHFRTEEKLMELMEYPAYKTHGGQHRQFLNKLRSKENLSAAESGDPGVLAETAAILKNWLFTHVAVQDKSLLWFFKNKKSHVVSLSKELIYSGHASLKRKHLNLYRKIVKGV